MVDLGERRHLKKTSKGKKESQTERTLDHEYQIIICLITFDMAFLNHFLYCFRGPHVGVRAGAQNSF